MKSSFILFLKGMAMGAANVIPGVSGGTVAFVTGIYERLINALKNIDLKSIQLFFKGEFKSFAERTDFIFLVILFAGVFVSILSLAKALELAFQNYEIYTLAFFFGLILASIFAVGKQISQISLPVILAFLIGTGIALAIAFLPPTQENGSFIYMLLCGVVAVCSMILPGLSGSYILLLMGNYLLVLRAISSFDFSILIPLVIGCLVGLVLLSRLLSYLFGHFKDVTISVLSGFVAGSLLIIWPWKTTIYETFNGKDKAVSYEWTTPELNMEFVIALVLIATGYFIVQWMERNATR